MKYQNKWSVEIQLSLNVWIEVASISCTKRSFYVENALMSTSLLNFNLLEGETTEVMTQ